MLRGKDGFDRHPPPCVLRAVRHLVGLSVVLALCNWAAPAAADDTKRVLILHSNQSILPATNIVDTSIRRELQTPARIDVFSEFLDAERFPEPDQETRLATFLQEKYARHPIDLVIATSHQALDFLLARRTSLFAAAPLLFAAVDEDELRKRNLPPGVVGVAIHFNPAPTVDLALRLQPNARRLVVVTGAAAFDRVVEEMARRKLGPYQDRLEVTYLSGLPMADLLREAGKLPVDTIVLYLTMFKDGAGQSFLPRDVAEKLSAAASAPVYGVADTFVGRGIVGGYMDTFESIGREVGRLAQRVLAGERPETIRIDQTEASANYVDWRQLRRWGLSESRLPSGTVVRFKEPSLWDEYKWAIVAALGVLVAQSLLIAALILQRRRRRRAESSLWESEERINLAAVSAHLGFWRLSIATDQVWATEICRQMVGVDLQGPVSLATFLGVAHPEDRVTTRRSIEQAVRGGKSLNVEFRMLPLDGSTHWIKAMGRTMSGMPGHPKELMGIVIDVTAEKEAELRSEEQRRELTHLARVALLGELSGAVAHELNQPLTAILTNAQAAQRFLAKEAPDMAEVSHILADIVAEDKRAGEVIRRLRTLYRKGETQLQPIDLNEVSRDVLQLMHSDLIARNVSVTARLAPVLPAVRGDRVQLQQVLLNLIVNACDAMNGNEAGERDLTVATVPDGAGAVQVCIVDCGSGIAIDMRDRLFQPFVTTKAQGLGLGLSICRSIVLAHGGRLWADNNPDRGATFCVALPADGGSRS